MEGRLQHATLAQVEIALAREQAVSQHDAGPFEAGPLLERLLMGDQHLADQVGAQHDVHMLRPDAKVHEVAVALVQPGHHCRRVVVEAGNDAERAEGARAGWETVASDQVRYCRESSAMLQPPRQGVPWWLRAYLLVGAVQGLAIGLTGLIRPAHVVGFPLQTTPLNTRFVAAFYLAGAAGLIVSAAARRAVDTRIFLVGFIAVTALLLAATIWYWSTYTDGGIPYPWVTSYVVEPIVGVAILVGLRLWRADSPGLHHLSAVYVAEAAVFAVVGLVLATAPDTAVRIWPWALTAVLARTYAAIFLAFALGAALAAGERRPQAVRAFAVSSLTLVAVTAAVSLAHHAKFDGGPSTWVWVAGLAAGLAGFAVAGIASLRPATETA